MDYKICNRSVTSIPKKKSGTRVSVRDLPAAFERCRCVRWDRSETVPCVESKFSFAYRKKAVQSDLLKVLLSSGFWQRSPNFTRKYFAAFTQRTLLFFRVNVLDDFSCEISFDSRRYCLRRSPFRNRISQRLRRWARGRQSFRFVESYRRDVFMIERVSAFGRITGRP